MWFYRFSWKKMDANFREIREAYDVTSLDKSLYPDEYAPAFRSTINELVPQLKELALRLLKCLALGLGYCWLIIQRYFYICDRNEIVSL